MTKMPIIFLLLLLLLPSLILTSSPFPHHSNKLHIPPLNPSDAALAESKRFEGSSDLVNLQYHMGPVLSSSIKLYLIWYGRWSPSQQSTIRDFLLSVSDSSAPSPSVSQWWSTVSLYADQTGANVTRSLAIAAQFSDPSLSRGAALTRLSIQQVISDAIASGLPADPRNGVYLVFTAAGVEVQDFCREVCGFHYFTFPSMVGHTLPYAWIGYSGRQCPDVCAYPFAIPAYMGRAAAAMRPPNGDVGIDGMVSVIAHELAELSTNPLVNAWYAGDDPTTPTEIGDLCEGVYGSGGGGGYTGQVASDGAGRRFNVNGRKGRKFLIQWVWSPVLRACAGPNAIN